MAWQSEEDFCCPACQDIFDDPVLLSCSHSFCKACLQNWWKGKEVHECPICRAKSEWSDPPRNLVLRNLCEAFLQKRQQRASSGSEALCSLHSEKFKLFCLDHQQPVCVVCRDAKMHAGHRFRPLDEVAQEHREELQTWLKAVRDKLEVFNQIKENCDRTAEHIMVQGRHTEKQINAKFEQLHRFLDEEREARMAALKEEEKQKTQMMKEKIDALCREMTTLSDTVRTMEKELRGDNAALLMKAAGGRVQQLPDDPQLLSGALIDMTRHLGNLTFAVWEKMKSMVTYSPLILDPNSASAELVLSEDLTSVRFGKRQHRPENPERFEYWDSVLASSFDSGTHSWVVEVTDNKDWELGVVAEAVCRQEFMGTTVWSVEFNGSTYRVYSPSDKYVELQVRGRLRKIRVHLDWDKGELSFYEALMNTHLHTFTHTFTEKLCPFICTRKPLPLKIVPLKVSVEVEHS